MKKGKERENKKNKKNREQSDLLDNELGLNQECRLDFRVGRVQRQR